jgi:hypothetical protein
MTYDIYHFKASVLKPRAIGLVGAFFSFSKLKCTIGNQTTKTCVSLTQMEKQIGNGKIEIKRNNGLVC